MLNLKSKIVCIGFVALLVLSTIVAWQLLHTDARLEGKPYTGTNLLERLITRNEGVKRSPYLDAKGNVIIGVGHELSITFTQANRIYPIPLNDDEIDALLSNDLKTVEKQLRGIFRSTRHSLNRARKAVIMDMLFNLGIGGFLEFHDFIGAVKKHSWHEASKEILDSKAARENPTRYQRNAKVMLTGDAAYFQLDE